MLNWIQSFLGGSTPFYPYESRILQEVSACLDGESAATLRNQIKVINKIQRITDGKEVNLYTMHHGKALFDDRLRFPNQSDEALLATVRIIEKRTRANLKVDLWLAKGRLFSLVFNKPPKLFFAPESLKNVQPEIGNVKIWFDPMQAQPVAASKDATSPF